MKWRNGESNFTVCSVEQTALMSRSPMETKMTLQLLDCLRNAGSVPAFILFDTHNLKPYAIIEEWRNGWVVRPYAELDRYASPITGRWSTSSAAIRAAYEMFEHENATP